MNARLRHRAARATCTHDAASLDPSRDPTGTLPIRRRFRRQMGVRFNRLRVLVREVLVAQDMLALGSQSAGLKALAASLGGGSQLVAGTMRAAPDNRKIAGFQAWIDRALLDVVIERDGSWLTAMIAEPYGRGVAHANRFRPSGPSDAASSIDALAQLAVVELQGIAEAVSQRAVRTVSLGLLHGDKPAAINREVAKAIQSVGVVRSNAMIDLMVVKAHATGTLDTFEAAGVKQVGTIPEIVSRAVATRDANNRVRRFHWHPGELVKAPTPAVDENLCHDPQTGEFSSECGTGGTEGHEPKEANTSKEASASTQAIRSAKEDEDIKAASNDLATRSIKSKLLDDKATFENVKDCVNDYTGSNYALINSSLREGRLAEKVVQKSIEGLDTLFKNTSSDEDMVVYRAVTPSAFKSITAGETYIDKGFVSTSAVPVDTINPVIQIRIPRGSRALPIAHLSQVAEEKEILIDRNSKFKVVRTSKGISLDLIATARANDAVRDAIGTGPGSRTTRTVVPSLRTVQRIRAAQRAVEELEMVEVLTAGDDDVCEECLDIADEGPYDIDEARSLIPAHPHCRCAFIPADDEEDDEE